MRDRRRGDRRCIFLAIVVLAGLGSMARASAAEVAIRGRVLDDAGRPLRGAAVELQALQTHYDATLAAWRGDRVREPAARAATDEAGTFSLREPEPGLWKIVVRAEGFVAAEHRLGPLLDEAILSDLPLVRGRGVAIEVGPGATRVGGSARLGRRPPRARDVYEGKGDWRSARAITRVAAGESRAPSSALRVVEEDGVAIAAALVCDVDTGAPLGLSDAAGDARIAGSGTLEGIEVLVLAADGRVARLDVGTRKLGDADDAVAIVTVPPAAPLTGTVVDDRDTTPLPGAWIWTDPRSSVPQGPWVSETPVYELLGDMGVVRRSGANGGFEMRVSAEALVYAVAVGHLPRAMPMGDLQSVAPAGRPAPPRVIRLQPSLSVGGVVVDTAGQAIAGVLVVPYAGMSQSRQTGRSITDERGRFRLGGMSGQTPAKIVALATGHAPAVEQVDLRRGGRDDVRIVLRRGRLVHGRVTDLDDRPVAKARVRFAEPNQESFRPPGGMVRTSPPLLAATRADGYFEIAGVASGHWDVTVDAAGYAITAVPGWEIAAGDGDTDLGVIRVGPGVIVEGIVVEGAAGGAAPQPLVGATVTVRRDASFARIDAVPGPEPWSAWLGTEPTWRATTVESDAEGRFVLRDLNPSEKIELRAELEGYVPALAPGVQGPTEQPIRLVLERGGTLKGRVVDENGEAVRAMVMAQQLASSQRDAAQGDAGGAFEITSLAPGVWRLAAQAEGFEASDADAPLDIDLEAGEVEDGVRIVLRELEHGEVDGRVVDQEGSGVSDASVSVDEGSSARTGAQGEFHLERVPLGTRRISAMGSRQRRATKTIEVREGTNTVELTLEEGVDVSGRVVDREAEAVAGATVSLRSERAFRGGDPFAMVRFRPSTALTDEAGAFRLESVPEGGYVLEATHDKSGRARLPGELQVSGAPINGLELVMEKGAVVRGALKGLDFDQLSQATVVARKDHSGAPGTVIAAEYEIVNLDAGFWRVTGDVQAHGLHAEGQVELEAGEEARVDLDFEGGLTLSGTVTRRGQPAPASSVSLNGLDVAVRRDARVDFEGRYVLRGLAEGWYELQASSSRGRGSRAPWLRRIELRDDTEIAIDLGGATISGLVLDVESGDALPGAQVGLRRVGEDTSRFATVDQRQTGAAGDFAYDDVPDGRFIVEARKDRYTSANVQVSVSADSEVDAVVLELRPSDALRLRVTGELGFVPYVQVMVFHPRGLPAAFPQGLRPDPRSGLFEVSGIADGSWSMLVGSGGMGSVWLDVEVPGPVRDVVLQPAARIEVEVPELTGTTALATLEVFDATGRPFPSMGGNQYSLLWRVEAGRGAVEGLPSGQWTLRALTLDGRTWSGGAVTQPGVTARARLQ